MKPEALITYISDFLLTPLITVFLLLLPIYIFIYFLNKSNVLSATLFSFISFVFGLLFFLIINYISNEIRNKLLLDHKIQPLGFLGFITLFAAYAIYTHGAYAKRHRKGISTLKSGWVGSKLAYGRGVANDIEIEIKDLPLKENIKTGKRKLYDNQSYELMEFLQDKITESNYMAIVSKNGAEYEIETESVQPYRFRITVKDGYESSYKGKLNYQVFFSDILDAIIDAYKNNKIKA